MATYATTIDEVIDALDSIIEQSRREGTRHGYFAALYRRTTLDVRDKCAAGFFEDNDRLLELDVLFANRYLVAMDRYRHGLPTSAVWRVAFEAAHRPRLRLIQHLLMGMNAHIAFDLGLSVIDLAESELTPSLHHDFDQLNVLLAGLVNRVQDEVARVSPLLGWLDRMALSLDETVVNYSIESARDAAWGFAEQLAALPAERRFPLIAAREQAVATVNQRIAHPGPLFGPLLDVVCYDENRHIDSVLDALTAE